MNRPTYNSNPVYWVSALPVLHYRDVIMSVVAFQITSLWIVHSTVCLGTDQRKHQSSALLAFVRGIHQWPVNSPHKGPVTWKMFPFDDIIITREITLLNFIHCPWSMHRMNILIWYDEFIFIHGDRNNEENKMLMQYILVVKWDIMG